MASARPGRPTLRFAYVLAADAFQDVEYEFVDEA